MKHVVKHAKPDNRMRRIRVGGGKAVPASEGGGVANSTKNDANAPRGE